MKRIKPNIEDAGQSKRHDLTDPKVPLRHKFAIKDVLNPITINRMRIFQVSVVLVIALAAGTYYWYLYVKAPSGLEVVRHWIDASGGEEAWNNIQHGSFQRTHTLYSESGEALTKKIETIFFEKLNGDVRLLMNYKTPNDIDLWMGQDKDGYWSSMNDAPADPRKSAKDLGFMCDSKWCTPDCSMKMAFYRLSMPFNLTGGGVIPTLAGNQEINSKMTNIVEVTYRPGVGRDKWVLYADTDEHLIRKIEYHHKTDLGNDLPEEMYWSDYEEVSGIKIPSKWSRYWTNGKPLEEYIYSNFDFESPLPQMFHERPDGIAWVK